MFLWNWELQRVFRERQDKKLSSLHRGGKGKHRADVAQTHSGSDSTFHPPSCWRPPFFTLVWGSEVILVLRAMLVQILGWDKIIASTETEWNRMEVSGIWKPAELHPRRGPSSNGRILPSVNGKFQQLCPKPLLLASILIDNVEHFPCWKESVFITKVNKAELREPLSLFHQMLWIWCLPL